MKFSQLVSVLESIEAVSSRNEMTAKLVELYNSLNLQEVTVVSYMLDGRVAPLFVDSEFQTSEKTFLKALQSLTSESVLDLRKARGDIGTVVYYVLKSNGSNMEVMEVYELLWSIVNARGLGSAERKQLILVKALSDFSKLEGKFFARIVCGSLRLGASVKTLLDVFSFLFKGDKSVREELDKAYGVSADIGYIAQVVCQNRSIDDLRKIEVKPGIPILSRLVERAKSFEEITVRMGESYVVQPKFDGLRLQIHKSVKGFGAIYSDRIWFKYLKQESQAGLFGGDVTQVKLFTRNLEDVTQMFPEIVEAAKRLKSESFILDSEVIGWDSQRAHFKSYQDTMLRKRKYAVSKISADIPVKSFAFDLMYLDGQNQINEGTESRIGKLSLLLKSANTDILEAESVRITDEGALKENFSRWVEAGLEGLIAKLPSGGYTPGSRNFEWIKLKKSFMSGLSDSIDVVILGYYLGSGKRATFGIGALLCGVYNHEKELFESVTRLGTGVTDELWEKILVRLKPLVVKKIPRNVIVSKILEPDVWVIPEVVCTIEADDITKAITTKGVADTPARGLSLRFPRMIEFDREKAVNQVTTVEELEHMFA
ncbi:hypothetical protein IT417_02610 [bacterium]|nr:hypothetical protein [bacterium]